MVISINIPQELEHDLQEAWGNGLDRAALEALATEGYRTGKLSRFQVQRLLGLSDRWETEAWLGKRGVRVNYSQSDLDADRATLSKAFGPNAN